MHNKKTRTIHHLTNTEKIAQVMKDMAYQYANSTTFEGKMEDKHGISITRNANAAIQYLKISPKHVVAGAPLFVKKGGIY